MSLLEGIGLAIGKITDWVPSKKESYKNEITKLKEEMDKLQKKSPYTTNDSLKYNSLADKLRQIENRYKNI